MQVENLKVTLERCISLSDIGAEVVRILLPSEKPFDFETDFWDYKRELPVLESKDDKEKFDFNLHQIIKDIVAFHNSFGGYILFGIEPKGSNRVIGCSEAIDCDDLSKRIKGATGKNIECYFAKHTISFNEGDKEVGLLLIPKRRSSDPPVSFIKAGPLLEEKRPYAKNDVYIRKLSECIPAANTAEDWRFLFSAREVERNLLTTRPVTPNNLPARDQDLIEFIGRTSELQQLRLWLLDDKSPIRLLTGIGGLGKTSLSYKFAEEVCEVGANNIEAVIWVTAKKETFAALKGKMVATTRNDFSNISDLLQKLITEISGASSFEEDMDVSELVEALVEGLKYKSCLVIVDDLDSLAPDQQKECATLLQQVVFRTVERDRPSSKFLLTSRLDQGMSPTTVIKVIGLPKDDFERHLNNLCRQFGLATFERKIQKEIFEISSGSPLFANAIVRLVSLGENSETVCKTWKSHDGEDVREFAFKRELQRLSVLAASVLLALLRLGTASIDEIMEVVQVPKKIALDLIGELQAYHLLTRSEQKLKGIVFTVSKELVAVTDIVQKHLGTRARDIDLACARIKTSQKGQTREIGIAISKMVSLWSAGQPDDALLHAQVLANNNPKNGDVHCALGKAYLELTSPNYVEADKALLKAIDFGCKREEVFSLVVKAKRGVPDWAGLRAYVQNKFSNKIGNDHVLEAHILANSNLIKLAMGSSRFADAANYALEGAQRISFKISDTSLGQDYFDKLRKQQNEFFADYVNATSLLYPRSGDQLEILNAIFKVFELKGTNPQFAVKACEALTAWFSDVEKRPVVDISALNILQEKISGMRRIETTLSAHFSKDHPVAKMVNGVVKDLEFRGGKLARR